MSVRSLQAQIHIGAKALGLDDDTYRSVLLDVTQGKHHSTAGMTEAQMRAVVDRLKARGWKPLRRKDGRKLSRASRDKAVKDPHDKLVALWIDLHRVGLVRDGSQTALDAWVRGRFGVDASTWLKGQALMNAIEALKGWRKRADAQR